MALVAFQISTGKFLEGQSHATPGTLIANAVRNGYQANDVRETSCTLDEMFAQIPVNDVPVKPTLEDLIAVVSTDAKLKASLDAVVAERADVRIDRLA